jgi:hypothetical protein
MCLAMSCNNNHCLTCWVLCLKYRFYFSDDNYKSFLSWWHFFMIISHKSCLYSLLPRFHIGIKHFSRDVWILLFQSLHCFFAVFCSLHLSAALWLDTNVPFIGPITVEELCRMIQLPLNSFVTIQRVLETAVSIEMCVHPSWLSHAWLLQSAVPVTNVCDSTLHVTFFLFIWRMPQSYLQQCALPGNLSSLGNLILCTLQASY